MRFIFWAGVNCVDKMSQESGCKIRCGQYVTIAWWMNSSSNFFVDHMSGFGVDEQSVHFHVRVGCSVTMDIVYMGRKIQWTIHVSRNVTRTWRTWTIHHSTGCTCNTSSLASLFSDILCSAEISTTTSKHWNYRLILLTVKTLHNFSENSHIIFLGPLMSPNRRQSGGGGHLPVAFKGTKELQ
jgi:hypothetical protein